MSDLSSLLADPGSVNFTGGMYGDPTRLWAHDFSPKTLQSLFKWTEYLYYNSAQIFSGVRKFAEYPITEINYFTDSEDLKSQYKDLLDDVLGIKQHLIKSSIDLQVYGNSFVSLHLPFKRFLECSNCSSRTEISRVKFKYKHTSNKFSLDCPNCNGFHPAEVHDKLVVLPQKLNIIRWDPKLMQISHNSITNESEYYLNISAGLKGSIGKGDKLSVQTMPMSILEAASEGALYKFDRDQIFHMKIDAPAGVSKGWGYPPLTAAIPLFHHAAVLRRANEAIALERIVPMRVMHPAPTSGAADPITSISVSNFMDDLEKNLKDWRKDPNHIMMSPIAVGVQQVGGEGRALMVDAEIQRVEDNIIASMGFPKEFIYGGLSFTGSSITLRMLENQLESAVFQVNNLLSWIVFKISQYMSWPRIKVRLGDFKMVDDVQQKQLVMNLWQQQIVSKTTVAETHGIDLKEEQDRIKNEQIADMRLQTEMQIEAEKMQNSLADQAKQMAAQGQPPGLNYDQQAVIAEADGVAQQMMSMDEGMRRSQLSALQAEDYVMYSVVIQRIEQLQLDMRNQGAM